MKARILKQGNQYRAENEYKELEDTFQVPRTWKVDK